MKTVSIWNCVSNKLELLCKALHFMLKLQLITNIRLSYICHLKPLRYFSLAPTKKHSSHWATAQLYVADITGTVIIIIILLPVWKCTPADTALQMPLGPGSPAGFPRGHSHCWARSSQRPAPSDLPQLSFGLWQNKSKSLSPFKVDDDFCYKYI